MNPIGILCIALSSGCGAALVWLLEGLRAARETQSVISPPVDESELEPVNELDADRENWDDDLTEFGEELADLRKKRARVRAIRSDTLRNIYLADVAAAEREEVAAQ